MEGRIGLRGLVGLLQLEHERHQRLGDEAAAEDAEMATLVGPGAKRVGLVAAVIRPLLVCGARERGRAAATKASILAGSFSPGLVSTPGRHIDGRAPVSRDRRRDVVGIETA